MHRTQDVTPKKSHLINIYKKWGKRKCENYRGISLKYWRIWLKAKQKTWKNKVATALGTPSEITNSGWKQKEERPIYYL